MFLKKLLQYVPIIVLVMMFGNRMFITNAITESDRIEIVRSIVWNPQGTLYAVGGGPSSGCGAEDTSPFDIFLVDTNDNLIQTLAGNNCYITSIAWSADGNYIASGDIASNVIVWNTSGMEVFRTSTGPDVTRSLSFDWHPAVPDTFLVVADWDNSGHIDTYDQFSHATYQRIGDIDTEIIIGRWEGATGNVITGTFSGSVERWNVDTNTLIDIISQHTSKIIDIEIEEQSQLLAVGSIDGELSIVDMTNDTTITNISVGSIADIVWKPGGEQLAVASGNTIQIFDSNTGQLIEQINSTDTIYTVSWSPDGSQLVYGGQSSNGQPASIITSPAPATVDCNTLIPASNTAELIAAINMANNAGTACTITLSEPVYTLTAVDNTGVNGANGLPVITGNITIIGDGATIERDASAPSFRFLEVAPGAILTLQGVSLSGGNAASNNGGAIYNQGQIWLSDGAITGNQAQDGGAIYNNGSLQIVAVHFTGNIAANRGGAIFTDAVTASTVILSCIAGNQALDTSGIYSSIPTFDAISNQWGSSDGPGGAGTGSGDEVNVNVDYANFTAGTCISTSNNFTLINADTDLPIAGFDPIAEGAQLDVQTLPTLNLNIRANVSETPVDYVIFDYNGVLAYNTEYTLPYALAQDFSGDYLPFTPPLGANTVTATPYISGAAGTPVTLNFTMTDSSGTGSSSIVDSFTLINADTDLPIAAHDPIVPGSSIDLATLPTQNVNIRANTTPPIIGRVEFDYNNVIDFRVEGVAPYALGGDFSGDYNIMQLTIGENSLRATPYTTGGEQGFVLNVNFTVIDSNVATASALTFDETQARVTLPDNPGTVEIAP